MLCVGAADPVGLRRLIGALDELREVLPRVVPLVVVNRVRATVVPGEPQREIAAALQRWAGIEASAYLPAAPAVLDTAMRTGRHARRGGAGQPAATGRGGAGPRSSPAPGARSRRRRRLLGRR